MKNWKPIVIYSDKFLNAISWFMRVGGISLFPFIILREKYNSTDRFWVERNRKIINHETIHFQQALELGVILFYLIYVVEYIVKALLYLNIQKGYYNISFEREAYANDINLDYLKTRKRYNWIKLIKK